MTISFLRGALRLDKLLLLSCGCEENGGLKAGGYPPHPPFLFLRLRRALFVGVGGGKRGTLLDLFRDSRRFLQFYM